MKYSIQMILNSIKDYDKIFNKYGLKEYDSFELLKKSGGKLPTDNLEFVDPIILNDFEEEIIRIFFIAGTRYYDLCESSVCANK